jgi:hypothetical protein
VRKTSGAARRFRDRYPGPWKIDRTPSGFKVTSGKTTLLYIYVHAEDWQSVASTGEHRLTWAEGQALAEAIVALSGRPVS